MTTSTRSIRRSLASAAAAFALLSGGLFLGAAPSYANELTHEAETVAAVSYAPECLDLVEAGTAGLAKADCKISTETSVGESFAVTPDQIMADENLTTAQRDELLGVAAVTAITGRHYSQFTTGVAYTRTHNGTFYYNGSRAWVTQAYSGYTGSHSCFTNYTAGLTIVGTECSDSGGTTWRTLRDTWTVGWGTVGAYSVTMACTVYTDGTIAGPGATVG